MAVALRKCMAGFKGQSGIDHNGKVWKPEARAELGRVRSPKPGEKSRGNLGKDQHRDPMRGLSEKMNEHLFMAIPLDL